jgi:dTMP kinase
MSGLFITFEGSEGCGKSTQIAALAKKLESMGRRVRLVREPGGTPIGEEIRHTLKHSAVNHAMTPEAELLLMNASRAQLVREVIRPALAAGEIVLCDRYYDSSVAYQGHGRKLDLNQVRSVIDFAVGDTRPDLTILFQVPDEVGRERMAARNLQTPVTRDRFEESDAEFFRLVREGFLAIAKAEPDRVKVLAATGTVEEVAEKVWELAVPLVLGK